MPFSRAHLFQAIRWTLVGIAVALSVWMLYATIISMSNTSIGWTAPLLVILMLIFTTPLGMIVYFGIKGDFSRLFTTVCFVISFLIFIYTGSALSHVHFIDIYRQISQLGFLGGLAGLLLSIFQLAAPFIPAVLVFRFLMWLLTKSCFPGTRNEKS